jgi:hypothetical protein
LEVQVLGNTCNWNRRLRLWIANSCAFHRSATCCALAASDDLRPHGVTRHTDTVWHPVLKRASDHIHDARIAHGPWTLPGTPTSTPQPSVTDSVVRSQSGRIMQNTLTDGTTTETSTYTFDAAGRLTQAVIPQHVLTYEFASTGACGVNTAAGRSGNRTGFTDTKNGTVVTDVDYCYDWADRLTSTNATTTGGNPVVNTELSTVGAPRDSGVSDAREHDEARRSDPDL